MFVGVANKQTNKDKSETIKTDQQNQSSQSKFYKSRLLHALRPKTQQFNIKPKSKTKQ